MNRFFLQPYLLFFLIGLFHGCSGGGDSSGPGEEIKLTNEQRILNEKIDYKSQSTLYDVVLSGENNLSLSTRSILFNEISKNGNLTQKQLDTKYKQRVRSGDNDPELQRLVFKRNFSIGEVWEDVKDGKKISDSVMRNYLKDKPSEPLLINQYKDGFPNKEKRLELSKELTKKIANIARQNHESKNNVNMANHIISVVPRLVGASNLNLGKYKKGFEGTFDAIDKSSSYGERFFEIKGEENARNVMRQHLLSEIGLTDEKHVNDIVKEALKVMVLQKDKDKKLGYKAAVDKLNELVDKHLMKKEKAVVIDKKINDSKVLKSLEAIAAKKGKDLLEILKATGPEIHKLGKTVYQNQVKLGLLQKNIEVKGVILNQIAIDGIRDRFHENLEVIEKFVNDEMNDINEALQGEEGKISWMANYDFKRGTPSEQKSFLSQELNSSIMKNMENLSEEDKKTLQDKLKSGTIKDEDIDKLTNIDENEKRKLKGKSKQIERLSTKIKVENAFNKFGQVTRSINNAAEALGIPKSTINVVNKASKLAEAGKIAFSAFQMFTGNPLAAISALSSIKNLFSNSPDPDLERHKEIMAAIGRIAKVQEETFKLIKQLDKQIVANHRREMKKLYDIESTLDLSIGLAELMSDKVKTDCRDLFLLNTCQDDPRATNQEDCDYKSSNHTVRTPEDLFNDRILKFRNIAERKYHFEKKLRGMFDTCIDALNLNLKNYTVAKVKFFNQSNVSQDSSSEELDFTNTCADKQSVIEGEEDDVINQEGFKKCIKVKSKNAYYSLNLYFVNYQNQYFRCYSEGIENSNETCLGKTLKSFYNPIHQFDELYSQLDTIDEIASYNKQWDSYNNFFFDSNKPITSENFPYSFNNTYILFNVGFLKQVLPWAEITERIDGKHTEVITSIDELSKHRFRYTKFVTMIKNSIRWLNLSIASESMVSGIPLLPMIYRNYFHNFKAYYQKLPRKEIITDSDEKSFEDCDDEKSSKYVDEECRTKIIVPNPGIAEVPKPVIPINPFKNMSDEEIENMKNKMKNTIDNLPPAEMHSLFDIPQGLYNESMEKDCKSGHKKADSICEKEKKHVPLDISQELIDESIKNNCSTSNRIADSYCVLIKNPLIRHNFMIYAFNKSKKNNSSFFLYDLGLKSEGDATLLNMAFKYKFNFHYESENPRVEKHEKNAPNGWSLRLGNTFTSLPSADEVIKGHFKYRNSLDRLKSVRDEMKEILTGLLIEQNKNAFENNEEALSEEEKKYLHEIKFK